MTSSTPLAVAALVIYICGGLLTFCGFFLVIRNWLTTGPSAVGIGILLVVSGIFFSMLGVLCMRIVRNRGKR